VRIAHVGIVVRDLDAAIQTYRLLLDREPKVEDVPGQGMLEAVFEFGQSRLELMQPTTPDSPVGRFLARRGEGLHHVAIEVEDIEIALARAKKMGLLLVDEKPRRGSGGSRIAFVHPKGMNGVLLELTQQE